MEYVITVTSISVDEDAPEEHLPIIQFVKQLDDHPLVKSMKLVLNEEEGA